MIETPKNEPSVELYDERKRSWSDRRLKVSAAFERSSSSTLSSSELLDEATVEMPVIVFAPQSADPEDSVEISTSSLRVARSIRA
jgi:hypothetical protein